MEVEGFKNFATFQVWHVIWNDKKALEYAEELIHVIQSHAGTTESVTSGVFTYAEAVRFGLSDALKAWVEEWAVENIRIKGGNNFYVTIASGLLQAGFNEVDWDEIAESLINRYIERQGRI